MFCCNVIFKEYEVEFTLVFGRSLAATQLPDPILQAVGCV